MRAPIADGVWEARHESTGDPNVADVCGSGANEWLAGGISAGRNSDGRRYGMCMLTLHKALPTFALGS